MATTIEDELREQVRDDLSIIAGKIKDVEDNIDKMITPGNHWQLSYIEKLQNTSVYLRNTRFYIYDKLQSGL